MSQFEELRGVIQREELLANTATLDQAESVEYRYGDIDFGMTDNHKVKVVHEDGETILNDKSLARLCREIGLNKYLSKIPAPEIGGLILPQLRFWLPQSNPDMRLRLLVSDNESTMSIPNADFEHVSVEDLIAGIEATLGTHNILGYHKPYVGPKNFQFSILTATTEQVIADHTYNAGIRVTHSIDGSAKTRVEPYLFNQWCTNGCTHEHDIKAWARRPMGRPKNNGGAPEGGMPLSDWLQESIVAAMMAFDTEVENLQRLANIPVPEDAPEVINKMFAANHVPVVLQDAVREQCDVDGLNNMYDLYQAITSVETHSGHYDDHPNARGKLNKVAAHLSHHTTFCPTCSTQMSVYDTIAQLNVLDEGEESQ